MASILDKNLNYKMDSKKIEEAIEKYRQIERITCIFNMLSRFYEEMKVIRSQMHIFEEECNIKLSDESEFFAVFTKDALNICNKINDKITKLLPRL